MSTHISDSHLGEGHPDTIWLRRLDVNTMTYPVSDAVVLNLDFVLRVLSTHGPIVDSLAASEWQWERRPAHVKAVVSAEMGLYPFLEWVIYRPAARALPAVLYCLFKISSKPMPVQLASYSRTAIIDSQHEFGSTDIVHFLSPNEEMSKLKRAYGHYTKSNGLVLSRLATLTCSGRCIGWRNRAGISGKARSVQRVSTCSYRCAFPGDL
jgi:hypothetical protein